MYDLRNWLGEIEDYGNNFLENVQLNFPSVLSKYTHTESSLEKDHTGGGQWLLNGELLLCRAKSQNENNRNEQDKIRLVLDEECFEGNLDTDGNGFGVLKKTNRASGLYEYLATGKFVNGKLEGKIKERTSCTSFCDCYYENGIRHGAFRKFHISKKLEEVGFHVYGNKAIQFCQKYSGGCYIIGEWSDKGALHNPCTFVYPDLQSAIIGRFEINLINNNTELKVIEGYYGKIIGVFWTNGIPIPQINITQSTPFIFDISTDKRLSQYLLLCDPYEDETVYVARSELPDAGEGLFAKKGIEKDKLVSFYNGIRYPKNRREKGKSYKWSDFRLALDNYTDLDIPFDFRSLDKYKVTLGHKACHTFDKEKLNVKFENFYHPRFGLIIALVSTRDISTNEEILVNYNYKNIKTAPYWYKNLWDNRNKSR